MYQALYRSFRPETFEEVLGQEHIVRILRNQIQTGTVSHAYLFCGTRGTGKTTTARLLAKGLNCTAEGNRPCGKCEACKSIAAGTYMDVIEIDAASNNGVDNIRELRESVKYPPALGKFKVYIIDEVHMLTTEAFNALLKTLEEPPAGVVFILASTEPQRIPQTILSRCLKLDFRRVSEQKLREGFRDICTRLGVKISDAALGLIAVNADGSVRDGLSLLDQCLSAGDKEISRKEVLELLGTSGEEVFLEITDSVARGETAAALALLARVLDDGKDVRQFLRDWMEHYRNLLIAKFVEKPEDILNLSGENTERLKAQAGTLSLGEIRTGILELSKAASEAKWSTKPRVLLELALVRLSAGVEEEPAPVRKKARPAPENTGKARNSVSPEERNAAEEPDYIPEYIPEAASADFYGGGGYPEGENPADGPASGRRNRNGEFSVNPAGGASGTKKSGAAFPDAASLWKEVASRAASEHGSLMMLGETSKPVSLDETTLTVATDSEAAKFMVETYQREIEQLLRELSGKNLRLHIVGRKEREARKNSAEDMAKEIGDSLGLTVEVE